MRVEDIARYVDERKPEGLTKIEIKCEVDEVFTMFVSQTKETYVFTKEEEADEKIDAVRQLNTFLGTDKKYKAGKVNKAGEIVKPETWTVTVKLSH